jgi:hypothetical protein
MNRTSVLLGRNQVVVLVVGAPLGTLIGLLPSVLTQQRDRLVIEIDHTSVVALGRRLDHFVADCDDRLANRQRAASRSISHQRKPRSRRGAFRSSRRGARRQRAARLSWHRGTAPARPAPMIRPAGSRVATAVEVSPARPRSWPRLRSRQRRLGAWVAIGSRRG